MKDKICLLSVATILIILGLFGGEITGSSVYENAENISISINEPVDKVEVEYYAPAPYVLEQEKQVEGKILKEVLIGSDASMHYTDVVAYTSLPNVNPKNVRIYHVQQEIEFEEEIFRELVETPINESYEEEIVNETSPDEITGTPSVTDLEEIEILNETIDENITEEIIVTEEPEINQTEKSNPEEKLNNTEEVVSVPVSDVLVGQITREVRLTYRLEEFLRRILAVNPKITGHSIQDKKIKKKLLENPGEEIIQKLKSKKVKGSTSEILGKNLNKTEITTNCCIRHTWSTNIQKIQNPSC